MQAKSLQTFDRQIQRIQTQLAQLGPMRPGTLTRQYRQPERQQGGYFQLSYTYQMRSRTEYVPKRQVGIVRKEIAVYQRYKKLTAQWIDLALRRSQLRMQLGPVSPCPILPCQRGSQAESWAPNPQKLWKTPLRHPPLNQHSTASVNENARKLESSAFSASL